MGDLSLEQQSAICYIGITALSLASAATGISVMRDKLDHLSKSLSTIFSDVDRTTLILIFLTLIASADWIVLSLRATEACPVPIYTEPVVQTLTVVTALWSLLLAPRVAALAKAKDRERFLQILAVECTMNGCVLQNARLQSSYQYVPGKGKVLLGSRSVRLGRLRRSAIEGAIESGVFSESGDGTERTLLVSSQTFLEFNERLSQLEAQINIVPDEDVETLLSAFVESPLWRMVIRQFDELELWVLNSGPLSDRDCRARLGASDSSNS